MLGNDNMHVCILRKQAVLYRWGLIALCVWPSGYPLVLAAVEPEDFARLIRQSDPLTPEEERASFVLPPGFEVQLVAAEPDIAKPMNLAFDAQGRLWVSSSEEYPYAAPDERPARDTIKVLRDNDGDGRADVITTFADDLNIPIGLYPFRDGVICYSIPHIWFLRDTDGDGKCDTREKLFGPFDATRDTHGMCNAFRRGFDGWLYACHGFNNQSTVAGDDGHTISMHSGNTFRMRLDGSHIEHFTYGQVNPFGMATNELGDLFTADCHTKPITLLLEGGYYESFGKPHDGLGFVPSVMQHLHGSTAIGGIALYSATTFPTAFRGNTFSGNVMTSRINRNSLHYDGSSVRATQEEDFLVSGDSWFRPVDLQLGPDGALYVADFYNRIIGHYEVKLDHPGRDRHRGRIWRIAYVGEQQNDTRGSRNGLVDLTELTISQLLDELAAPNLVRRMRATDLLVDRFADESIAPARELLHNGVTPRGRVQALWVLFRRDAITATDLERAVRDVAHMVRIHAFRVLRELINRPAQMDAWLIQGFQDSDPNVRRSAVMAASQQLSRRLLEPLVALFHRTPHTDVHLRHAVRLALRNHLREAELFRALTTSNSGQDTQLIAGICLALRTPEAGDFMIRNMDRLSSADQAELSTYVTFAARYVSFANVKRVVEYAQQQFAGNLPFQQELLESAQAGLKQRGAKTPPVVRDWALSMATEWLGTSSGDTPLKDPRSAARLAAEFHLTELHQPLADMLRDPGTDRETCSIIASSLVSMHPTCFLTAMAEVLTIVGAPDAVRRPALEAIILQDSASAASIISDAMQTATAAEQLRVAEELAAANEGIELLLNVVESGRAAARLLTRASVRQKLDVVANRRQRDRIEWLSARLPDENEELSKLIGQHKARFLQEGGSREAGEEVFRRSCAACHQVGGVGKQVGPNLDGIGNRGLDRLVEDILAPNRNVDVAFRSTVVLLESGQVLSGLVKRTEGAQMVLVDAEGNEVQVPTDGIEETRESILSPMPVNFGDVLMNQDFPNLLSYLISLRG